MKFKLFDIVIQIAIPIIAILVALITKDGLEGFILGVLIFYGGLAIWQLSSAIVHLFFRQWIQIATKQKSILFIANNSFARLPCSFLLAK